MIDSDIRLISTVVLILAGPIAWIVAEFVARPLVRRVCAVFALCSLLLVGALIGMFQGFRLNRAYSGQTHELLETAADSLRAGKNAQVLQAFERASKKLQETYEGAGFLEITKEAITEMKK